MAEVIVIYSGDKVRVDAVSQQAAAYVKKDDSTVKPPVYPIVVHTDGESGTKDYNVLRNKPSIEGTELIHDKALEDFGMGVASRYDIYMLFQ